MNEGMQDSVNLGWKLAFVLRGRAEDTLFTTYSAERSPLIADVLKDTNQMMKVMEAHSFTGLRDLALIS